MERGSMNDIPMIATLMVLSALFVAPQEAPGLWLESHDTSRLFMAMVEAQPLPKMRDMAVNTQSGTAVVPPPDIRAVTESGQDVSQKGNVSEYVSKMRNVGYPLDLDKDIDEIVRLRLVGVSPEFAQAMGQTSLGRPTPDDLITLKSLDITVDYIASFNGTSLTLSHFSDVATIKSLEITPDYVSSLMTLGLGKPSLRDVVTMRYMDVSAAYVASLRESGIPPANLGEAVRMKTVGVTPEYARAMTALGFSGLKADDLIALRAEDMTLEDAKWFKAHFPDADSRAIRQAVGLHIDADFLAKAKSNGFDGVSLDKLVRIKTSGLLD